MASAGYAAGLALAGVALFASPAGAQIVTSRSLQDLGLTESLKDLASRPTLSLRFSVRADHVPTAATLRLWIAPGPAELALRVNQQPVARWGAEDGLDGKTEERIEIDPRLIGDRNILTFEVERSSSDGCRQRVPTGTWKRIVRGELSIESSPLPLANDLGLLPLPFMDPEADRSISVPIVILGPPSIEAVRAAGVVASYFGVKARSPIRFPVHLGVLPNEPAVVLGTSARVRRLGLRPGPEPHLSMVDHPTIGPRAKLLVLSAERAEGLQTAARGLFLDADLHSPSYEVEPPRPPPAPGPYEAPRWAHPDAPIRLGDLAEGASLEQRGGMNGVVRIGFRVAPDLFVWPSERFVLDLVYEHVVPIEGVEPKLEAAFNGFYVGRSHDEATSDGVVHERLHIHRSLLRGYNELALHVSYEDEDGALCDPIVAESVRTVISPESTIHLEGLRHFSDLPDLLLFVHDGYPFTRFSDLRETLILLPAEPKEEEIGAALSALAHLASITGAPGSRVEIRIGKLAEAADKDVLVVGAGERLPLPSDWRRRMPLSFVDLDPLITPSPLPSRVLALLSGRRPSVEARRLRDVLARARSKAAVVGFESPVTRGRSVIAITAPLASELPAIGDLRRPAGGEEGPLDVLVLADEAVVPAKMGPSFHAGHLGALTRARWFIARHWLLLFPSLILGTLLPSVLLRRHLAGRVERRLSEETKE